MKRAYNFLRRARAWISQPRLIVQERIVISGREDICTDPIFLIGLHRSGTSLMRRIINAHPEIVCPPETFFIKHYAAMLRDPYTVAGFRSFGHSESTMRTQIARQASEFHEGLRLVHGKRRWADKTPQYVDILPELSSLFGPDVRFIMIYRHPFDVAYSVDHRGWNITGEENDDEMFSTTLSHMAKMYRKQMLFEASHPELCVRVHYEDLVANPEATLRRVMKSLGEGYSEQMMRHHEGRSNFGTEDPIARGTKGFKASHGNWIAWDSKKTENAKNQLSDIAIELGYSVVAERAAAGGRA